MLPLPLLPLLLSLLSFLQEGAPVILHNGTYIFCATSAEEAAQHMAHKITGGVNTLHQVDRQPCGALSFEARRFRTHDGTCNAKNDLGAAFSPVKRLAPSYYDGTEGEPRERSSTGRRLPSAREVSLAAHWAKSMPTHFTLMLMQFGQLLDHDLTLVPVATEFDDTIKCCGVPKHLRRPSCFPIENPEDDHIFGNCSEFVRSEPMTMSDGTVPKPRQHVNAVTAWLDASNIYGSDRERARALRTQGGKGALLKTSRYKGQERLPRGHDHDCVNKKSTHFCSVAGDDRVNEQPGLTALHLVFHLEHNRLVRKLAQARLFRRGRPFTRGHVDAYLQSAAPETQEQMYQIVRKVVGAVWQKTVYHEYLPLILGPRLMGRYKLWTGGRVRHDPSLDPSISMEFLSAAFRFGHTLINDFMFTNRFHRLKDLFSVSSHNLDFFHNIVEGLVGSKNHAEPFGPHLVSSVTDHLFANTNGDVGLDLAALNIQRGRDHGIPSYTTMRKHLHLRRKSRWSDFGTCEQAMKRLYEHPDDVDTFTGGTCERSVWNGVVGELFGHIIGRQFQDLKFADKYYYETDSTFYGFTDYELRAVNDLSFSKILCENAQLASIQPDPFMHPHRRWNPMQNCSAYEDIDMWWWTFQIK